MRWMLAAGCTVLLRAEASAASVTFEFAGTVTRVFDSEVFPGDEGWIDSSIQIGTPFTGMYTFDPNADDLSPDPTRGSYQFPLPGGIEIRVGNYVFRSGGTTSDRLRIVVEDGSPFDAYAVGGSPLEVIGPLPGGLASFGPSSYLGARWRLVGGPGQLASSALPTSPPPLSGWTGNRLEVAFEVQEPTFGFDGVVTTIVPEPGSGLLAGAACAWMAWRRRRTVDARQQALRSAATR
jgi:hypothetical protein